VKGSFLFGGVVECSELLMVEHVDVGRRIVIEIEASWSISEVLRSRGLESVNHFVGVEKG
jgi:hypothetical protein